jgi:urease accessory protein
MHPVSAVGAGEAARPTSAPVGERPVGMRSAAALVAERVGDRTRCTTLRSDPPLGLRTTGGGDDGEASVHLVGTAAGPLGGDELCLTVTVGAGARLAVRSVAASVVLPGLDGWSPTRSPVEADHGTNGATSYVEMVGDVAAGGSLRWLTEPTILVAGCDHRTATRITLDAGASLVWREVVVLGRHSEPSGSLLQRLRVDVDGRPLVSNDLAVGPAWPGSQGPAGVGPDARAVATIVVVGASAREMPASLPSAPGLRAAVLPLATAPGMPCAVVVSAVAAQAAKLVGLLDELLGPMS